MHVGAYFLRMRIVFFMTTSSELASPLKAITNIPGSRHIKLHHIQEQLCLDGSLITLTDMASGWKQVKSRPNGKQYGQTGGLKYHPLMALTIRKSTQEKNSMFTQYHTQWYLDAASQPIVTKI